jgi:hypothetical protein
MTSRLLNERRQSRINRTRELILAKGLSGLLNNKKWLEIFEHLENERTAFDIKLLSEDHLRHADFILELENTSVLVDNTGDFVDFLEIEFLRIRKDDTFVKHLDNLEVDHLDEAENLIIIQGYR